MLRTTLLASASLATIVAACQVSAQSSTKSYSYDALGRLTQVEVAGGSSDGEVRDYAYDDASNRTQVTASSGGPSPTPTPTPTPTPAPSLSVRNSSVSEGGTASFTVSLSAAGSSTITTQYATSSAGSASSDDFSARSGTLTFYVGQTSKTIGVPTIEDSAVEADETFYFDLSNPSGATIADSRGVGTIVNDDSAPSTIQITDDNLNVLSAHQATYFCFQYQIYNYLVEYCALNGSNVQVYNLHSTPQLDPGYSMPAAKRLEVTSSAYGTGVSP